MNSVDTALNMFISRAGRSEGTDRLFELGKQASDEYLSKGTPLTKAVIEKIAGLDLNNEQIKRVTEIANSNAFMGEFDRTPGENVEISGGPADSDDVIAAVNEPVQTKVAHVEPSHFVFLAPRRDVDPFSELEARANVDGGLEKDAEAKPAYDLEILEAQIKEAHAIVRTDCELQERRIVEAYHDLQKEATALLRDEHSLGEVVSAILPVLGQDGTSQFVEKLAEAEGFRGVDLNLDALNRPRIVNQSHPLVECAREVCASVQKLNELLNTEEVLAQQLDECKAARR